MNSKIEISEDIWSSQSQKLFYYKFYDARNFNLLRLAKLNTIWALIVLYKIVIILYWYLLHMYKIKS